VGCEIVVNTVTIVYMSQLSKHYRLLLGLDDAWRVDSVDLQLEQQMVVIRLEHKGGGLLWPECGGACSQAVLAPNCTSRPHVRGR
jgi:hypothetical protein